MSNGNHFEPVFRFVALRGVQKLRPDLKGKMFFANQQKSADSPDLNRDNSSVFQKQLHDLIGTKAGWRQIKDFAAGFARDKVGFISHPDFGIFEELSRMCDQSRNPWDKNSFFEQVANAVGDVRFNQTVSKNLSTFINLFYTRDSQGLTAADILWDTLYALAIAPASFPSLCERIIKILRMLHLLENKETIFSINDLWLISRALPLVPEKLFRLAPKPVYVPMALEMERFDWNKQPQPLETLGCLRPLGIGDLKVVQQSLKKYEMNEIAYVENVMQREYKERKHRRLDQTQESVVTETESSVQEEKDLQSSERYELQREASNTIDTDTKYDNGLTVSAAYGPVSATDTFNYTSEKSVGESSKNSTVFAKEIIDRSLSVIMERVRQERTVKILREVEETNTHGFDNKAGTGHIIGIYRWLDKIYRARVVNYGKRLLYEFSLPEPAAFYVHSEKAAQRADVRLPQPPEPRSLANPGEKLNPFEITENNYQHWVMQYRLSDVTPPPPKYQEVSLTLEYPSDTSVVISDDRVFNVSKKIKIPDHYQAVQATVCGTASKKGNFPPQDQNPFWTVWIGKDGVSSRDENWTIPLTCQDNNIPVVLWLYYCWYFAVNVTVKCQLSPECFAEWQLKTYASIMTAYAQLEMDYQNAVEENRSAEREITIKGRNPEMNRFLEQQELKKGSVSLLRKSIFDFDAIHEPAKNGYPEIDLNVKNLKAAGQAQFFEQAFEWEQMTYLFYPYFWGRRERWLEAMAMDDTDPLFTKFLQAGAARVVVPVRPAYETALVYYLASGEIWNGGEAPIVEDDMFVSIIAELKAQADLIDPNAYTGEEWDVKIPTTLVKLQQDDKLPE
jgi:hypothetical protein